MSGVTKHPSIVVKSDTSLSQVAAWMSNNKADGLKLYAKQGGEGETVLYLKSGSGILDHLRSATNSSIFERLGQGTDFFSATGSRAKEKQDLARNTVGDLMGKTLAGATDEQKLGLKRLFAGVRGDNASSLQNRDAQFMFDAMDKFANVRATMVTLPTPQKAAFQPPSASGLAGIDRAMDEMSKPGKVPVGGEARFLAGEILKNYANAGPEEKGSFVVALAHGDAFKAELEDDLVGDDARPRVSRSEAKALAADIYKALSAELPAGRFEGNAVTLTYKDMAGQDMTIDLKPLKLEEKVAGSQTSQTATFNPDKVVASGGFGLAVRCTNPADGRSIIVKVPIPELDVFQNSKVAMRETADELMAYAGVAEGGSDHIIGLKGAVRMEDGAYAIAMEYAPNGTVNEAIGKLSDAVSQGRISQDEADVLSMTLIRDMAEGLTHMHDVVGTTHYDFKSPNCLIGEDGKAKIMDFGTSFASLSKEIGDAPEIDNTTWKAPEILYGALVAVPRTIAELDKPAKASLASFIDHFGVTGEAANELMDLVLPKAGMAGNDRRQVQQFSDFQVTNKVDVWGLGTSAYELLSGGQRPMAPGAKESEREKALAAFAQGSAPAIGAQGNGSLYASTGNQAKDAFLNRILVADPANRPSAADVASDPAMNVGGIGSDAAHALIAALTSPKPDPNNQQAVAAYDAAIRQARADLQQEMV